jgi:integrase
LSRVAIRALENWIAASGKKRSDYLFPGRGAGDSPMSTRQLSHLLKDWVIEAGLDPSVYSVESLRRTKALHILKGTGDLQTVRALLGHVQIESTARYLGLKTKVDPIEVSRAFDMYDSAAERTIDELRCTPPACPLFGLAAQFLVAEFEPRVDETLR